MIEPKIEIIDGMKFNFQPLEATLALKLDKKVISLVVPALGGVKDISLDTEIDLKVLIQGIGAALRSLEDEETERFVLDLLNFTLYIPDDGKTTPQQITKEIFNQIFTGKLPTVYKLIFAVMKYNKFSPFELVAGGNVMKQILTSLEKTKKEKRNGSESERSGNLLET